MGATVRNETITCWDGFSGLVARGERRVAELEQRAQELRERLEYLDAKVLPEWQSTESEGNFTGKYMSKDGETKCALRGLAQREKILRKNIFEMECVAQTFSSRISLDDCNCMNPSAQKEPKAPETRNKNIKSGENGASEKEEQSSPKSEELDPCLGCSREKCDMAETITRLKACGKKLCTNLKKQCRDFNDLTVGAETLSRELDRTREAFCEKIIGPRRNLEGESESVPLEKCECGSIFCRKKNPPRVPSITEPKYDKDCPCGGLMKCYDCTLCSCADWEEDLKLGSHKKGQLEKQDSSVKVDEGEPAKATSEASKLDEQAKSEKQAPDFKKCICKNTRAKSQYDCACLRRCVSLLSPPDKSEFECSDSNDASDNSNDTFDNTSLSSNGISSITDTASANTMLPDYYPLSNDEAQLSPTEDNVERCRGGVDMSPNEANLEDICACSCHICALRHPEAEPAPCCPKSKKSISVTEDETDEDEYQDVSACTIPIPEIGKICKVEKLRESLEKLKNRNHALRRLLKERSFSADGSANSASDYSCSYVTADNQAEVQKSTKRPEDARGCTSDLIATIKILQNKCRTKDGMIVTLADELKRKGTCKQTERVLKGLVAQEYPGHNIDFDRTTLWKYLLSRKDPPSKCPHMKKLLGVTRTRDLVIGFVVLCLVMISDFWIEGCILMVIIRMTINAINIMLRMIVAVPRLLLSYGRATI